MAMYQGFSTYNRLKKFHVTDFELVQQDIFNHFNIRKGEKLMNPNFGTIIWGMLYEPLTDEVRSKLITDIKRIAAYDPRVNVTNIGINEYDQGIQVTLDLVYLVQDLTATIALNFDRASRTLTRS
jgi:phage baseplate assembly protein W